MANDKKIPTKNLTNLKWPLSNTDRGMVDPSIFNKNGAEKWKNELNKTRPLSLDAKKVNADLEKSGKNSKVTLDSVPSNKQNSAAQQNSNKCSSFCRVKGFNILPLRYSVTLDRKNPLPANLGKNVKNIQLSNFGYTVTMVNTGYVYCLTKRVKSGFKGNWSGYKVTPKGYLSYFVVDKNKMAPVDVDEFACQSSTHQFAGSVITIEEKPNDPATEAYIIYTHAPISDSKRAEYENNADAFVAEGKWQKVKIGGGASQEHCFGEAQINSAIYNLKSFGDNRIKIMKEKFTAHPKAFVCMGLYDAVGITSKLNESRNIKSFGGVNDFLNEKENGITNNHKLQTLNLIDNIEKAIKEKIIKTKFRNIDADKNLAVGHIQNDPRIILSREQKEQISKNIEERHEKSLEVFAQRTKASLEAIEDTNKAIKKYQHHLNINEIENFRSKIDSMSKKSFQTASDYESDHYSWLTSSNLIKGLYYFDQSEDIKKIGSDKKSTSSNGFIFHVIVMDLMNGMTFLSKGQKLIDKWLNEKTVKDNNLYLRAYCFNNKKLMASYNQTFASSGDGVKTSFDTSKQIFGVFKEADAAFDQWLDSVDGKSFLTQGDFKTADKMFYWMSLALNSTLKTFSKLRMKTLSVGSITGVSGNAQNMHAVHLYYLRTGDLAKKVPLESLFYNLEFNKAAENVIKAQNASYINPYVLSVGKEINLHVKAQPNVTKNRLLAIVAVFELLNFYTQYDAWEADALGKPEVSAQLAGSFLTLTSATLELLGEKWSITQKYSEGAIAKTRLTAASLGTIGSFIGILIDRKSLSETNDLTLKVVLFVRLAGNAAILISQTLSLIGVALSVGGEQAKRRAIAYSSHAAIGFLTGARFVASANLIVIGTVAIEMIVKKYFIDNDLEDWCQKCAFYRADSTTKDKVYKNNEKYKYLTEQEELDGYIKAIGVV